MLTINLYDSNFPGQACSVPNQVPRKMKYVRERRIWDGMTFFTDGQMYSSLVDQVDCPFKVGWLHEPLDLHPENYQRIERVKDKFTAILTTEPGLWKRDPKFWPYVRGGCWIPRVVWGLYSKKNMASTIISDKRATTGHRLRHQIVDTFGNQPLLRVFGSRGIEIGVDKRLAYQGYHFAVVVENCRREGYFVEQVLDAIAFGTVPIYHGCPNIGDYLDERGILTFETLDDLAYLLPKLSEKLYHSMLPHIEENLRRLEHYAITEDWIVDNLLEPAGLA